MKSIRFHRILFPVLCLILIIGYSIAGIWIFHAPRQSTAMLEDISGSRDSLEGFTMQFDLADNIHTQSILLCDKEITFTTSYRKENFSKKSLSAPIDGINLVFVPTPDANTKIESGFLPGWQDYNASVSRTDNMQGHIIYTDKVQLYFECMISDKAYIGNILAPSGLYIISEQQDICIAYTETILTSWDSMDKTNEKILYDIYHTSCNNIEQNTMLSDTITGAKVNGHIFFAVSDCLTDYPAAGQTGIYQIDASAATYESPNPLHIEPYGQISPIITFDAEKASVLNLRGEDGYLLATIRIGDAIYLYLFSSKGKLLDIYPLPENFPVDMLPSYFHNYDTNGDFYLSLLTPNINQRSESFDQPDLENDLFPGDDYFVICLKLHDEFSPVFAGSCSTDPLRQPVVFAWRNHKLLCIQQAYPNYSKHRRTAENFNYIFQKEFYIEVRSAENQILYSGKLLTDAAEDLRSQSNLKSQRQFRRIILLDDPTAKEHTNYALSNDPYDAFY